MDRSDLLFPRVVMELVGRHQRNERWAVLGTDGVLLLRPTAPLGFFSDLLYVLETLEAP